MPSVSKTTALHLITRTWMIQVILSLLAAILCALVTGSYHFGVPGAFLGALCMALMVVTLVHLGLSFDKEVESGLRTSRGNIISVRTNNTLVSIPMLTSTGGLICNILGGVTLWSALNNAPLVPWQATALDITCQSALLYFLGYCINYMMLCYAAYLVVKKRRLPSGQRVHKLSGYTDDMVELRSAWWGKSFLRPHSEVADACYRECFSGIARKRLAAELLEDRQAGPDAPRTTRAQRT